MLQVTEVQEFVTSQSLRAAILCSVLHVEELEGVDGMGLVVDGPV